VPKTALLEPSFDEDPYRTAIIDWSRHLAKPVILVGVPTTHLPGKRFCPAIGSAFDHHLIASPQQPKELPVTSGPAIYAPNCTLALLRG
jgi:hypothetical protein